MIVCGFAILSDFARNEEVLLTSLLRFAQRRQGPQSRKERMIWNRSFTI